MVSFYFIQGMIFSHSAWGECLLGWYSELIISFFLFQQETSLRILRKTYSRM